MEYRTKSIKSYLRIANKTDYDNVRSNKSIDVINVYVNESSLLLPLYQKYKPAVVENIVSKIWIKIEGIKDGEPLPAHTTTTKDMVSLRIILIGNANFMQTRPMATNYGTTDKSNTILLIY